VHALVGRVPGLGPMLHRGRLGAGRVLRRGRALTATWRK
jgi:hypothetical protein